MSADWSERHFSLPDDQILSEAKKVVEMKVPSLRIKSIELKKWRYCQPEKIWKNLFENLHPVLCLAGDAFGGPSPVGPGLTIESIKKNVLEKSQQIRAHKDPHLGPLLKIVRFLPKWMLKRFLGLYSFLIYEFDTRLGIKFIPHKPFGAVIISNVGSLGIKKALLPLVPLARASGSAQLKKV